MAPRIPISAAIVAVLMGCSTPPLKVVSWNDCPTAGGTSATPAICAMEIPVSGSCPGADVDFDKLDLSLNGSGNTVIVWKLPAGYQFCPAQGDGAFLKFFDDTEQFGDPAATDNDAGVLDLSTTKCKKNFRLRDDNTRDTAKNIYKYRIQFTDRRNKTSCTMDPQIRNG
jgi:hypothetical protein